MIDISALTRLRNERFFATWDGSVSPESIEASEQAIRSLLDSLVALGPVGREEEVRLAVHQCVERFNELDQGWIFTIEREDICDCLGRIVHQCGMDGTASWVAANREW